MLKLRIDALSWIFAAFTALLLLEYQAGVLAQLERRLDDLFVRMDAEHAPADRDIVIVDIDDKSLERMAALAARGEIAEGADRWPWGRSVHGELAAGVARQKPQAIVFDVIFSERDLLRPDSDRVFNDIIAPLSNVYIATAWREDAGEGVLLRDVAKQLGMLYGRDARADARANLLLPQVVSQQHARMGLINALLDPDRLIRRAPLYLSISGWKLPSLAARVAADLGYRIPQTDAIVLRWSAHGHEHVSFSDLYEDFNSERPQRDQREFRGKIVLIGTAATGLLDLRATPLSEVYPGVEILATAIDNLKNQNWIRVAPAWLSLLIAFVAMSAIYAAFVKEAHTLHIGVVALGLLALLLIASYAAMTQRLLLPVFTPVAFGTSLYFACALQQYLQERRERLRAVDYFSRFVNPHVVKDLLGKGGLSREGETREITVLFTDIRGFTTLSETRTPASLLRRAVAISSWSMRSSVPPKSYMRGGWTNRMSSKPIVWAW